MKRNRNDWILLPVILLALYLGSYLYLRETRAYQVPFHGVSGLPADPLPLRQARFCNQAYQPLIFLDGKLTGKFITFVSW